MYLEDALLHEAQSLELCFMVETARGWSRLSTLAVLINASLMRCITTDLTCVSRNIS